LTNRRSLNAQNLFQSQVSNISQLETEIKERNLTNVECSSSMKPRDWWIMTSDKSMKFL